MHTAGPGGLWGRRSFLGALVSGLMSRPTNAAPGPWSVEVTLTPRVAGATREIVNFGVPFAPGQLADPATVRALDETGRDVGAAVRALTFWKPPPEHSGNARTSVRSIQIQARLDVSRPRHLSVTTGSTVRAPAPIVAVTDTLVHADGLEGPRVRAQLPSAWLCASLVAGPQTPASASGPWAGYDADVERNFPASLRYLDSDVYHHWLFDRPTVYYKQYVRTGAERFLDAATHAAHFMRVHTAFSGPTPGYFTLKGPDVKYVYPRAMHLLFALTGDDRARDAGIVMAAYCRDHWDPVYRPERYTEPPLGVDPEKDRAFWSPRHQAYGLLGVLHGWQLTGDAGYWRRARAYVDALAAHQAHPPDGRPADGSWRQDWALYDPNETRLKGATSAWMTAILVDALFEYWWLSGDARVPGMITRWCDFLDRRGFVPDGSRAHYVIDCLGDEHLDEAPGPQGQGMERHNTELAYTFAMGLYFSRSDDERARFRRRFDRLFASAITLDANAPERAYNWAFQASSQLVYVMGHLDSAAAPLTY